MNSQENQIKINFKAAQQIFQTFTIRIEQNRTSQIAIRRALKKYEVKNMKINNVTPLRARKMFETLQAKYQSGVAAQNNWLQNQRRIFVWCLICYIHQKGIEISQMKQEHFAQIHQMFPHKELELIKFQGFSLVKKGNRNQGWVNEEDQILTQIIQKQKLRSENLEWSQISKQFFQETNQKYFRSSKQCRQRWLNHLDPSKTKGKWQNYQDIIILKEVLKSGKKWSKIAHLLEDKKNQHMVKNRYKSLIHKMQNKMKSKKIQENKLIELLIESLEKVTQNSQLKDEYSDDKDIQSQEDKEKINEFSHKQLQKPFYHEKAEIDIGISTRLRKKQEPQNIKSIYTKPIIIESSNKKKWESFQPKEINKGLRKISTEKIYEDENEEDKIMNEKQVPEIRNQIQFFGPGGNQNNNTDFLDRIFHNVNHTQNNNKLSSIMLDARSPGFLMSPFQPGGWTPTIFFVEDPQGQVSPQVSFGNFGSKFTNDFHKFINSDESQKKK